MPSPAIDVPRRVFSVVPDFFAQSTHDAESPEFDVWAPSEHLGLLSGNWTDFRERIRNLQAAAASKESYKVIFAARHGQGYHNVKEAEVGTPLWDCKWSLLYGDGDTTWGPDPELTALGREQAGRAHAAWARELAQGAPSPDRLLSSPLTRAASTAAITWTGLTAERPLIREIYRENIGLHTCDQRRARSYLRQRFANFDVEAGFSEADELWTKDTQEPASSVHMRMQTALEELFALDPGATYISITAHGGTLSGLKAVTGHPDVSISPGGMVPVVVRARLATPTLPRPQPSGTAPSCPSVVQL